MAQTQFLIYLLPLYTFLHFFALTHARIRLGLLSYLPEHPRHHLLPFRPLVGPLLEPAAMLSLGQLYLHPRRRIS